MHNPVAVTSTATPPPRAARRAGPRAHRGQTLVVFALAQLVLLGALGLALDGGFLYAQRRAMQNAADAASQAGAGALSRDLTDTAVTQAVFASTARNGVADPASVSCTFFTNAYPAGTRRACSSTGAAMSALDVAFTGVEVRVAERHGTFVMRALGVDEAGTAATAAAQVQVATKLKVGPFMVCALDTAIASAPAGYTGGIFQPDGVFPHSGKPGYIRDDGYANCQGGECKKAAETAAGRALVNPAAFAYEDGGLNPIVDAVTQQAVPGPAFTIHAPSGGNGITRCNNNSSSFKGVYIDDVFLTYPVGRDYWRADEFVPKLTTGNVTSVQASVEGINGCKAGAPLDDCVVILPIVDNSGKGGVGTNTDLAVRMLGAFYIRELQNGQHTGELLKHYNIVGESAAYFAPGMTGPTVIRLIK